MATFIPPNNEEGLHIVKINGTFMFGRYTVYEKEAQGEEKRTCMGYWDFNNDFTDGPGSDAYNFDDDDFIDSTIFEYVQKWCD